ncbi:MAG: GTPase HflX, partial [Eubacterium sp.]|nr:GTPase HflX [Eubacterium sp.]
RLGGGIGTRGPGEKKLEQDRRVIRNRVAQLKRELDDVVAHRELTRKGREMGETPVFAIVGYTNVGKSTLLNALTGADILAENKLFATLDTTTRVYEYSRESSNSKQKVLLTDTVGFIRKLPHNLIDAFRSTLEEVCYSDYIIHVVDASSEERLSEMHVVYETLDMLLKGGSKKIITIFNKIDKLENPDDKLGLLDKRASAVLQISAKKQIGLDEISKAIDGILREDREYVEMLIDYKDMAKLAKIKAKGEVIEEEYQDGGVFVKAYIPREFHNFE